jgi:membrane protease YdiL (CAAX protease family)
VQTKTIFNKEIKDLKNRYAWVIIVYVLMQLSYIFAPFLLNFGFEKNELPGIWSTISFSVALIIITVLLLPDIKSRHNFNRSTRTEAFTWSVLGIFLVFAAHIIASLIESNLLGIDPGSENTQDIVTIAKITPLFIIVVAIIGPILEEIIFRKIIFGSLYKRFNFIIAGLVSGLAFAVVHVDFKHLLVYLVVALTFSFLYVKTNRILVPIVAHVSMNSFVVLVQVIFSDEIQKIQENIGATQFIFGGLLTL